MFVTVRTARTLCRSTRALSTVSQETQNSKLLQQAMGTVNSVMAPASGPSGFSLYTPPPPPPVSSTLPAPLDPHQQLNIPPADDPLLAYFASRIQRHGNRQKATRIMTRVLLHLHAFTRAPPLPLLRQAVLDAAPAVRSYTNKQGGKNVSRPIALDERQRTRYAVQFILAASDNQSGQTLDARIARAVVEVLKADVVKDKGEQDGKDKKPDLNFVSLALKKKVEIHKFAMVNRGNARSRI